MGNGKGILVAGLLVAISILIVGILHWQVANKEREDLARFQCAQINKQIDYKVNEFGSTISEGSYNLDDHYTNCLMEKGLSHNL